MERITDGNDDVRSRDSNSLYPWHDRAGPRAPGTRSHVVWVTKLFPHPLGSHVQGTIRKHCDQRWDRALSKLAIKEKRATFVGAITTMSCRPLAKADAER